MDDQAWTWSSGVTQPLVSVVVTLWSLTLLYLPRCLFAFILSPVLVAAAAFFLILLRLSAAQRIEPEPEFVDNDREIQDPNPETEAGVCSKSELDSTFDQKPLFVVYSFIEWDVRAPLEVIYEEESENEDDETTVSCLRRHTSLSRYFPETDSDTSSSDYEYPDWDSPEKVWNEDDANGLIEISLDSKKASDFEQEDNLIEIDISPARSFQIPAN